MKNRLTAPPEQLLAYWQERLISAPNSACRDIARAHVAVYRDVVDRRRK